MDSVSDLAKAGTTDFSWINKGIESGQDYALRSSQLELNKQAASDKQEELAQQRQANLLAKSQHIFDIVNKGLGQVGKARDVYFKTAEQQANVMGIGGKFDPTFWAYMNDPKNNEAATQALSDYNEHMASGDWAGAQKALMGANGLVDADSMKKYSDTLLQYKKEQEATDISKQNANTNTYNAQTQRLKVGADQGKDEAKNATDLSKRAEKIQTAYSKLENPIEEAMTNLSLHTKVGDRAANVALAKIAGVNRFNKAEADLFGPQLGTWAQQAEQAANMRVNDKGIYDDTNRQQIQNMLGGLDSNIQNNKRDQLAPIYNDAKTNAPDQLNKGTIFTPKTMAKTFNMDISHLDSEKVKDVPAKNLPPLPGLENMPAKPEQEVRTSLQRRFNGDELGRLAQASQQKLSKGVVEKFLGKKLTSGEAKFFGFEGK